MAAGSHATYGGWEPRHCSVCGERIVLSGPNARGAEFRFNVETGKASSRHANCKPSSGSNIATARGLASEEREVASAQP